MVSSYIYVALERIIKSGSTFLTVILASRFLTKSEFGEYSYYIAIFTLFLPLGLFGLEGILIRKFVCEKETDDLATLSFYLIGVFSIVASLIFIPVLYYFTDDGMRISYLIIVYFFQNILLYNYWFQAKQYFIYNFIAISLASTIALIFKLIIAIYYPSIENFCYIFVLESLLFYLFLSIINRKVNQKLNICFFKLPDFKPALILIKESIPLFLSGFIVIIFNRVDQIMLMHLQDSQALAIYAVSAKVNEGLLLIPAIIMTVAYPKMIKAFGNSRNEGVIVAGSVIRKSILICISVFLFFLFFSNWFFTLVFSYEYRYSGELFKIHSLTILLASFGILATKLMIIESRQNLVFYANFLGLILNITLNYVLIPIYSYWGAVIATIITQMLTSVFVWFLLPNAKIVADTIKYAVGIKMKRNRTD